MRLSYLTCGIYRTRSLNVAGGVLASLIALGGGPAQAQQIAALPAQSDAIAPRGGAKPTQGWIDFCKRYPSECAVDLAEPAVVELTPKFWQTMVAVNRKVNADIKPVTDKDHWGVDDRWDFPDDGCGDCEDYQLLKRRLLAQAGVPRRAMRMTVVIDEEGQGHAVMMVRTTRGDFILDNKRDSVLPWHQTGYVYIKQEGQNADLAWAHLGGAVSPTVTANR